MRATARAEFLRFHRKSSISPTSWIADPEAMDDSRPGHRALRKGRASAAGQVYLVTTAAYRRNPFFREWDVACEACRAITAAATAADGRVVRAVWDCVCAGAAAAPLQEGGAGVVRRQVVAAVVGLARVSHESKMGRQTW